MRFEVRIKESLTSEHIYTFESISKSINCVSYKSSNRNGDGDIWGEDWATYNRKSESIEYEAFEKKYGKYSYFDLRLNPEANDEYERIQRKYSAYCHKTVHGKPYLRMYAFTNVNMLNEYPPPIPLEEFNKLVREAAHKLVDEMEIK